MKSIAMVGLLAGCVRPSVSVPAASGSGTPTATSLEPGGSGVPSSTPPEDPSTSGMTTTTAPARTPDVWECGWDAVAEDVSTIGAGTTLVPSFGNVKITYVLPSASGGPAEVVLSNYGVESTYGTFGVPEEDDTTPIISGVIPRGVVTAFDVWDGVSAAIGTFGGFPAGDVTGDGVMDIWYENSLMPGPLLGRTWHYLDTEGAVAWLKDRSDSGDEIYGDAYDVDGDGHMDIVHRGQSESAEVLFGPVIGEVPAFSEDTPDNAIRLGDDWGCLANRVARWIPDAFGPGTIAVALGENTLGCPETDTYIFDLTGVPRGTQLSWDDAVAQVDGPDFGGSHIIPMGDVTGDGATDVYFSLDLGGCIFPSPYPEWMHVSTCPDPPVFEIAQFEQPIPDVNGDGMGEIISFVGDIATVHFSPFCEPTSLMRTLPLSLEGYTVTGELPGDGAVDLDGDGIVDLTWLPENFDTDYREVLIWWGADLLDELARRYPVPAP